MALGLPGVAACYDCHGHHDIVPLERSAQPPLRRATSSRPAGSATRTPPPKFTDYIPHANHTDRENYPVLYWTFVVHDRAPGRHVRLLRRPHAAVVRCGRSSSTSTTRTTFREPEGQGGASDDEWFIRFRPFERFLHFLVVTSFLLLVITGMPLKFYYTDWARAMFALHRRAEVAGALHRFGAIITFVYFALHLGSLAKAAVRHRDAVPRTRRPGATASQRFLRGRLRPGDAAARPWPTCSDSWAHQKWFFGTGPQPQFDRWTYWEKFDYFAVFWGVAIIGLSGLIMWFPESFTRFLPGWIINIALIVHSDEALLAAGFIFTFHFFNTHFRLEKFPMDTVIFSGRISQDRDAARAQALVRPAGGRRGGSTTSASATSGRTGSA